MKSLVVSLTTSKIHRRYFSLRLEQWFYRCDQASDNPARARERKRIHASIVEISDDTNSDGCPAIAVSNPKRFANNPTQCNHVWIDSEPGIIDSEPVQGGFIVRVHYT
jgi:hypothetical protein